MEEWLHQLFNWLPGGAIYYMAIAVIAFLESLVAIGVIVPGSTIIVFTGFLALHGKEEREMSTRDIGAMVMEGLKALDQVAYVRFASVYRRFEDLDAFMEELNLLVRQRG